MNKTPSFYLGIRKMYPSLNLGGGSNMLDNAKRIAAILVIWC